MSHSKSSVLHSNTIDRFNQEKLYIQLSRIFLEEIKSGKWQLNQRIPSEGELCKKYEVSKITVRQAVNNLVSDGYLMKLQGKGTFVTSVAPVVGVAMKTRFTEEMFGKEVIAERKILTLGEMEPPPLVKEYLKTGESIYYILSKRMVQGETAYIEESFIPSQMLPDIRSLEVQQNSLYSVLQERGNKKIFKVIQTIEIARASMDDAKKLDLDEGVPVLVVHRLFISSDNTPVAYTKIQGRSDRYKLQTEFERLR